MIKPNMSRKRVAPIRLFSNGIPTPNIQVYEYEYYRPGCYYIPQVVREVTPYNSTYLDHWQPYCNAATYVVDRFGRANYPSDFEYQLQVPTSMHPQPSEVIYNFYSDGEAEISSLPQIEEEDLPEEQGVSVRKRKRFNDENKFGNEISPKLNKSCSGDLAGNVYRSKEGYLVEEPNDNVSESV